MRMKTPPRERPAPARPGRSAWRAGLGFGLGVLAPLAAQWGAAQAAEPAEPAPQLSYCATIAAPNDRLACYDKAVGRAAAPETPPAYVPLPASGGGGAAPAASSTSLLEPKNAPPSDPAEGPYSLLSKYWELDRGDKRGVFNLVGYRSNYVLPLHVTSRINRSPQSPSQAAVSQPNYRNEEAKFQLSVRAKVLQDVLLPGADLWVAYTQQAMWQIWNGRDSKPFRNSDYEPELSYIVPTPQRWQRLPPFGWRWRYTQLSLTHQSNGQSDPLSRSWNRVTLGAGIEQGDWSLSARALKRIEEPADSDNNPDLVGYRGRGEVQLNWAHERHTLSLLYRTTLKDVKYGALQLEWTYPVFRDQPNGLRWYVQLFRGYGETLTDYNFRQTSLGAGVSFLQF